MNKEEKQSGIKEQKEVGMKNKTVIRNLLLHIILYFQVFNNLQCHILENLKKIYVLSEYFHQSTLSGYQNYILLSSPILHEFMFRHVI